MQRPGQGLEVVGQRGRRAVGGLQDGEAEGVGGARGRAEAPLRLRRRLELRAARRQEDRRAGGRLAEGRAERSVLRGDDKVLRVARGPDARGEARRGGEAGLVRNAGSSVGILLLPAAAVVDVAVAAAVAAVVQRCPLAGVDSRGPELRAHHLELVEHAAGGEDAGAGAEELRDDVGGLAETERFLCVFLEVEL